MPAYAFLISTKGVCRLLFNLHQHTYRAKFATDADFVVRDEIVTMCCTRDEEVWTIDMERGADHYIVVIRDSDDKVVHTNKNGLRARTQANMTALFWEVRQIIELTLFYGTPIIKE